MDFGGLSSVSPNAFVARFCKTRLDEKGCGLRHARQTLRLVGGFCDARRGLREDSVW